MARIRTIRPEFFLDSKIGKKHPLARLFFIGLWLQADCAGRLEEDQDRLKLQILPYDKVSVEAMLQALEPFLDRYEVAGKPYISIKNFLKHQRPHPKEPKSEYPSPLSSEAVKKNGEPCKKTANPQGREGVSGKEGVLGREGKESPQNVEKNGEGGWWFEDFWKNYPRKVGKEAALRAWVKLGPDKVLVTWMLESLAKQSASIQWRKDGGQYIPHASTWLNGKRWEDQVEGAHIETKKQDQNAMKEIWKRSGLSVCCGAKINPLESKPGGYCDKCLAQFPEWKVKAAQGAV